VYKIPAKTHFIGKSIVFVPECHSTNTLATEMSQKGNPEEGTVIITADQTLGKGQKGNAWLSEPGKNLTFSIIIKPTYLPIRDQFYLTMITSLALKDFLSSVLLPKVEIKWPNDIMVEKKKIAGILIENQIQGNSFTHVVVGVGLNVNQVSFHLQRATSMKMIALKDFDLNDVLDQLCIRFEHWYMQLKEGNKAEIKSTYLDSLFGRGQRLPFKDKEGSFTGTIEGIDDTGRLITNSEKGIRNFEIKEIQWEI